MTLGCGWYLDERICWQPSSSLLSVAHVFESNCLYPNIHPCICIPEIVASIGDDPLGTPNYVAGKPSSRPPRESVGCSVTCTASILNTG
ncbi:Envelopment polyprotein [Trichinella spiralis]|uniref:Envelopment polyprotein n=1 Tax=Trichinella spiralis TaxID=6334 RepID=A0ABR3KQ23_TRISP